MGLKDKNRYRDDSIPLGITDSRTPCWGAMVRQTILNKRPKAFAYNGIYKEQEQTNT